MATPYIPSPNVVNDQFFSSASSGVISTSKLSVSGAASIATLTVSGLSTLPSIKTNSISIVDTAGPTSRTGLLTLVAGTATLATRNLAITDSIIVGYSVPAGANSGAVFVSARANGTPGSFTVKSTNVLDTSVVSWQIIGSV